MDKDINGTKKRLIEPKKIRKVTEDKNKANLKRTSNLNNKKRENDTLKNTAKSSRDRTKNAEMAGKINLNKNSENIVRKTDASQRILNKVQNKSVKNVEEKNVKFSRKSENEKLNIKDKKNQKKLKKKKRGVKIAIFIMILAVIGVAIYLLLTLSYFDTKYFEVFGSEKYSQDEVIEATKLQLGTNVFLQLFKNGTKNAKVLPYLDTVKIGIDMPNKVKIIVTERKSTYFAFDKEKNKYYRLDSNGYILEECLDISERKKDELLTKGIFFDTEITLGNKVSEIDLSKLVSYTNIYNEFVNVEIPGTITMVNFENSLTTITINDKLNVILPNDTNLKYNMLFLKEITKNLAQDSVGVIDMTKSKPIFSSY